MTRLIDADELIQIFEADEKALADREFQLAAIGAANTVRKMPTIDAEPVIRCKDCKYKETGGWQTWCCQNQFWVTDYDFCSRAERSNDG